MRARLGVDVAHGHVVGRRRHDVLARVVGGIGGKDAGLEVCPGVGEGLLAAYQGVGVAVALDGRGKLDGGGGVLRELDGLRRVDRHGEVAVGVGRDQGKVNREAQLYVLGLVGQGVLGGAVEGEREGRGLIGGIGVAAVVGGAGKHIAGHGAVARLREHLGRGVVVAARGDLDGVCHELLAVCGDVFDAHLRGGAVGVLAGDAGDGDLGVSRRDGHGRGLREGNVDLRGSLDGLADGHGLGLVVCQGAHRVGVKDVAVLVDVGDARGHARGRGGRVIHVKDAVLKRGRGGGRGRA